MKQFECRRALSQRSFWAIVIYGQHVESRFAFLRHLAKKITRDQREVPLLIAIDRGFGRSHTARRPGFYLDEAEDVVLPAYKIKFSTMIRRTKIAGDDNVAAPPQVEVSSLLTSPAGLLMSGDVFRSESSLCQPVQQVKRGFSETAGKHG